MTQDGKHPDDAALGDVSKAYAAAGFEEAPPPHVDRAIVERAARHTGTRNRRFPLDGKYLAWAAVLVLSVALVLELTVRTPSLPTSVRESLSEEDDDVLEATTADRAENGLEAATPATETTTERQLRFAIDSRTAGSTAADAGCAETLRAMPAAWVACLVELRRDNDDAFGEELAAFRRRYPDYALPREIATGGR